MQRQQQKKNFHAALPSAQLHTQKKKTKAINFHTGKESEGIYEPIVGETPDP